MSDGFGAKADTGSAIAGLDKLTGPLATRLARSMAVASGTVYRDEAKLHAPKDEGVLADSIYLAFKEDRSTEVLVTYSITWNARKAPHGHLLEFGHWQTHATYRGVDGKWYTNKDAILAVPKWVPAKPFLRPAFDTGRERAQRAAVDRGRERLPELLRDAYQPPDEDFV
jgi:HK97 gp10 family phage protein